MTWCDAEDKCKRSLASGSEADQEIEPGSRHQHTFAGYGYRLTYHPECCPGYFDGSRCFEDKHGHPEGWKPEDQKAYDSVER